MKKIIFLSILSIISRIAFAQTFNSVKIDTTTSNVAFDEIVKIDSVNKNELYLRAREWFAKNFKSANSVLQMDDKDAGKLIGKASQNIWDGESQMFFTVSIFIKDNRFKYSIENIKYKSYPSQYNPNPPEYSAEELITDYSMASGKYKKKIQIKYREETLKAVNEISESIKKALTIKSKGGTDDW